MPSLLVCNRILKLLSHSFYFFLSLSLETPTTLFGQRLRDQVEERLVFYDSGSIPRKNSVVMKEVIRLLQEQQILSL